MGDGEVVLKTIRYVATQAGHDPQLTLSTYGHLLAEYADADRIDAEREIVVARGHELKRRLAG